ncbi:MAG: hypothetical protein K6G01_05575 [Eubacterium sp.]|nr:hypothetical protein [Eubacterium sp.]
MEIKIAQQTKYEIIFTAVKCGNDLSVTITGGTKAHVGAVALACGVMPDGSKPKYSATVSAMVVMDHKDDVVARKVAGMLADALQANVTVTAGIHVDDATVEELKILQENVLEACKQYLTQSGYKLRLS